MRCPNCTEPMEERAFDRLYGRSVAIDVCRRCQGLWFDDLELLQLTPGATLELFTSLGQAPSAPRTPLAPTLCCPRCGTGLREAHDLQRTTRFSYFQCPNDKGRWLTFYQFLRAKNFVRSMSAREIDDLRRRVRQVNCANCGAPVDLDAGAACRFCRTPIAILDPEQVRKVAAELTSAEQKRRDVDPTLPVRLAAERAQAERVFAEAMRSGWTDAPRDPDGPWDLLSGGLQALARWLGR